MPRKYPQLLLVWLCSIVVSGCRDHLVESLLEPPLAVAFDASAFMADPGDAFVLLATTNSGKLLEIDVDAGTVRLLGQSQNFEGHKPGWTGITSDASTVFTSSRKRDDIRDDGCVTFAGHTPCTHLYTIDASTGLITADRGSMGKENVSDIDISPTGTMFGSRSDPANEFRGQLVTIDQVSGVATTVGTFFSTPTTVPPYGGFAWLVNGGLSVHPTTGTIWGIESGFFWGHIGPRLFTVDGSTGEVTSVIPVTVSGGNQPQFGFDGLEIMPNGRFFASRGGSGAFEIYEIDPTTGAAVVVSLTIPSGVGFPNGLETITAPRAVELTVNAATMRFDPGGVPAGDNFSMDATFELGAGSNGLDLTAETFLLSVGDLGFTLPAGSFSLIGGVFKYTSPGPGLTRVEVDESDGTLRVDGAGLTVTSLVGGPVTVNLQMGDDVSETTATFIAPLGIPPQPGGEFYSVTNKGELLIIDLGAETGTAVGTALREGGKSVGWTGLAFSPNGELFTSSRFRDGSPSDGCVGGASPTDGKCAHVYQVDPLTGGIVTHVGNTGIQFLSDLQFDTDGLLLGNEFINARVIRDGGLIKINLATGLAARKGTFSTFDGFVVGNGGLALRPSTGQLWGIEANDLRPRIFQPRSTRSPVLCRLRSPCC